MADQKTLELQIKLIAQQATSQLKLFATDVKNAAEKSKGFTGNANGVATSIKAMQQEASRAATSIKLFGGNVGTLRNTTAQMKNTILDLIQGGLKPESEEIKKLVSQYKNLEHQIDSTEKKQNGLLGFISELKSEIGSLAIVASALAIDKALVNFISGSVEINNSFQAARDNFGIMLNDMQAGKGLFNELQEFNFWTPFDIETTSQATSILRTAKVQLGDITTYLTRFGDLAQGNSQRFLSFSTAFSKASAKGKADMEVLNIFIDQGVQILDQLAKQMGKTSAEIVKMASEGKISFKNLDQAIAELTAEGGIYYNTMATAAMRLDAVQAGLEESTKSLRGSFGEMLAPAISKVLSVMTDVVDLINGSPILKGILAAAITAVVVAVNVLAGKALVALIAKLWSAYAAQMGLNTALSVANPALIALTAAAAAATLGFVAYAASQQKAADATAEHALELQKLKEQAQDMSWMDGMSVKDAQAIVNSYKNIVVPAAEEAVKEAEKKLASIPKTIEYSVPNGRGGMITGSYDNAEYTKAEAELKKTQEVLDRALVSQEAAINKLNTIKQAATDAIAKFGTEWQDKIASETPNILAEEARALEKLNKKAEEAFGVTYATEESYRQEVQALNKFYDQKREEELKKRLEKESKMLEEFSKTLNSGNLAKQLEAEQIQSQTRLAQIGEELIKKGYITKAELAKASFNMELDYEKRIHQARLNDLKNYRELDAERLAKAAKDTAFSNGGELGQVAKGFAEGGVMGGLLAALKALVVAVLNAVGSLENGGKVLNFISTIVDRVFKKIGNLVNDALGPSVEFLNSFGDALGSVLTPLAAIAKAIAEVEPILKILTRAAKTIGDVFDWLYNDVIVPVANALIKWVNKIPGVNIDYLEKSKKVEELSEEIAKAQEMLKQKYDRLISSVNDLLNSQLEALKSQYELGLISRDEYQTQAEKYAAAADEKRYQLEKEMDKKLAEIEKNTEAVLNEEQKSTKSKLLENEDANRAIQWGAATDVTGFGGAIRDALESGDNKLAAVEAAAVLAGMPGLSAAIGNFANGNKKEGVLDLLTGGMASGVKNVASSVSKALSRIRHFDVGTPEITYDHLAMVHQGETIIPKTFAQGIRDGDLALVGKKDNTQSKGSWTVNVNIGGSVVTENQIVDAVYAGIAKGIQSRKYTPLPGGAA